MHTQAIKQLFLLDMMDFMRCFISVLRRWPAIKQLLPICCAPTFSNSYWLSVPKCAIKNMDSPVNIIINTEAARLTSSGSLNSTSLHQVCKLGPRKKPFSLLYKPFWLIVAAQTYLVSPWRRPNEILSACTKQSSKYTFLVWSLWKGKGRGLFPGRDLHQLWVFFPSRQRFSCARVININPATADLSSDEK